MSDGPRLPRESPRVTGSALREFGRRVRVKALVEAKMLLQRVGVPRRADVLFACAWEWRYPPYLYLSLREGQVLEAPRRDLPFFLTYGSLGDFFLRLRGVPTGAAPTAQTVVSQRAEDLTPSFRRRIRLDDDYFAEEPDGAVTMPYFCHPDFYRLRLHEAVPALRVGERTVRVFFAGTADDAKYDRQFAFPLATRGAILRAVTAALADELTTARTRSALAAARDGGAQRLLFALSGDTDDTTDRHLMTPAEYIALMARSDFFLAPPGWVMPHCHNIVEAMSVGTIPITNYGGYLAPSLEDGVTCLAFDTAEGAVAAVRRALAMPPAEVAAMRASVVRYHDEHLAAPAFRRRLDRQPGADVTVRVNAERGR